MSEQLRDSLKRVAGTGEPALGDAFMRFTKVKRRAAIARGSTVAALAVAAAATLIFTLPGLNPSDGGQGLVGGDASPPPRVRAVLHHSDPVAGFELDYPADWDLTPNRGVSAGFTPAGYGFAHAATATLAGCDDCAPYATLALTKPFVRVVAGAPSGEDLLIEMGAQRAAGTVRTILGAPVVATRWTYPASPAISPARYRELTAAGAPSDSAPWCSGCVREVFDLGSAGGKALRLEVVWLAAEGDQASIEAEVRIITSSLARL